MRAGSEPSRSASNPTAGARHRPPLRPSSARSADTPLLEPVTRTSRRDAIAYAARRPYENVFLHWVLEGGHGPGVPDDLVLNRDYRGKVTGLAYFGGQCVVAADDATTLDAFAVETRKYRALRSIVGTRDAAEGLWERVRAWHRAPSLERRVQPLYALLPADLAAVDDAPVRRALAEEAELVADHSAEMIAGELGYDPRRHRAGWIAGVRRAIAQGSWWVWIEDGELRFQCNVGPRTTATAQVQGVWTPPPQRGRGYATLALAATARRLFASEASLSLYVNDFNAPAIALYERLGFERVGTFATYLFP